MSPTEAGLFSHAARREKRSYFFFFVVFFDDFLVAAFFFLAAMPGTSFLVRNVKLEIFGSTGFLLGRKIFRAGISVYLCSEASFSARTATARIARARMLFGATRHTLCPRPPT